MARAPNSIASWLRRLKDRYRQMRSKEKAGARSADAAWRDVVEKDLFGANTSDYTYRPDKNRQSR